MTNPPKERRFVECFKSNKDGSCNYCKARAWKTGYKIYAMKKDDGKWLACTDRKCYLEQGGKLTLFNSDTMESAVTPRYHVMASFQEEQRKGFIVTHQMDKNVNSAVELTQVTGMFLSSYNSEHCHHLKFEVTEQ